MSIVVEDGTGLANAESYASVATADAYWAARSNPAAWSSLDVVGKETNLRTATEYLVRYSGRWRGSRVSATQALDWPRACVTVDRVTLPNNAIPVQLQRAVCELALKAASGPLTVDEGAQVKAEAIGPLSTTYADGARQQTRYAAVEAMLAPLLRNSGGITVTRA